MLQSRCIVYTASLLPEWAKPRLGRRDGFTHIGHFEEIGSRKSAALSMAIMVYWKSLRTWW